MEAAALCWRDICDILGARAFEPTCDGLWQQSIHLMVTHPWASVRMPLLRALGKAFRDHAGAAAEMCGREGGRVIELIHQVHKGSVAAGGLCRTGSSGDESDTHRLAAAAEERRTEAACGAASLTSSDMRREACHFLAAPALAPLLAQSGLGCDASMGVEQVGAYAEQSGGSGDGGGMLARGPTQGRKRAREGTETGSDSGGDGGGGEVARRSAREESTSLANGVRVLKALRLDAQLETLQQVGAIVFEGHAQPPKLLELLDALASAATEATRLIAAVHHVQHGVAAALVKERGT